MLKIEGVFMNEYNLNLHHQSLVVDGHCDSILECYKEKRDFIKSGLKGHLDLSRLKQGGVNLQFLALFIETQYKPYGALCRVLELLDFFYSLKNERGESLQIIKEQKDLLSLNTETVKFLLTVEGGEALEGQLSTLRILFRLGIRSVTLTWNQRNQLGDGVWERESGGGLTTFGKAVIKEMNDLGMLVDVSHLSEGGFWDVISYTTKPIAATHSCCRVLHEHPRNLRNEQMEALQKNQGIIGINFCPEFLGRERVTAETVIEHIEYAAGVAGVDHVGLGSDFDGIETTPAGLEDVSKMPLLTELLLQRGWKEEEVRKVLGGNYIRVLQQVLPPAQS
jgi:membrane dipeptidase